MQLLSPAALAWLGLLIPLVVLYMMRRERETRVVGSTLLWEAVQRDLLSERPLQRLVPRISLLLQILAIVVGALALSRPTGAGGPPVDVRIVAVIDASPSMLAADAGGVSRVAEARAIVSRIARSLPPGGELMVVEAGPHAAVTLPFTADPLAAELAMRGLEPRAPAGDLRDALAVAAERLRDASAGSRIVVISDGAREETLPTAVDGHEVEFRQVGSGATANTAIVAADARASGEDEAPDRTEIFARVGRFAESAADVYVTASVEGRGVVSSRRVLIDPGEVLGVLLEADLPPDDSGRAPIVEVTVAAADGSADALSQDDHAFVPAPGGERLPVFLIGEPSPAVERVLRSDRDVELFRVDLDAMDEEGRSEFDLDGLRIYSGRAPREMPPGQSVVLDPDGAEVLGLGLGEPIPSARVVSWSESDPRFRFVNLAEIRIGGLRPSHRPSGRVLLHTDAGPAALLMERSGSEALVLPFDPGVGPWARHPSFVVFFRNLLEHAREERRAGGLRSGGLGEPIRIAAGTETSVRVEGPDGFSRDASVVEGMALVPVPPVAGAFEVQVGERRLLALRGLLDAGESDLRVRMRRSDGGVLHAGGAHPSSLERSELWPWLALLLGLILALEVTWATRRGAP